MPIRNGWLPREGFTSDALGPIIKKTLLNPALTLPLVLLARYTKRGSDLSILHETAFRRIKLLLYIGLARWANNYLNKGVLNNWVKDDYNWGPEGEIVVITGGSGGIGGCVVRLLAEKGVRIAVLDVIPLTYEAPPNVYYFKCDITSTAAINTTAQEVRTQIGAPTILINNAGVARGKTILTSTEKDVRFTFDVNTISHYFLAQAFVPSMIANNHGMVVTVASIAAYVTVPAMVDYAASKAAAMSFHEGLAAELATREKASKVRTVVVNQGYTRTPLFEGYSNSSKFLMPTLEPETVAEEIVKQVLKGQSGQVVVPGFANSLGVFRGMPHWYQNSLRNKGERIMTKWKGRQVIDVEKDYRIKGEKEESVDGAEGNESASTVLVPPE